MAGDTTGAKGVERIAKLLRFLSEHPEEYGVRELARKIHLTKSTMQRMLNALEAEDLVAVNPMSLKYGLGYGVVELARPLLRQGDLPSISLPFLRHLRDVTSETACLHVRVGDRRVTLLQIESPLELRFTAEIGKGYPLHAGASGQALMAFLPDEEIERIIDTGLPALSPNTETRPDQLRKRLLEIRERGYVITFGERTLGGAGIAVPVRDGRGEVIASMSIYGPDIRLTESRLLGFIPVVRETATALSEALRNKDGFPIG